MTKSLLLLGAMLGLALPSSALAQPELKTGFEGALRGCEEWVLNPASWAEGLEPFVRTVGLGNTMGLVASVDEAALPPRQLRVANHYWRINSTANAGYILVVSDELPMCHITGGGGSDLQPIVEEVLASAEFNARWDKIEDGSSGGMISSAFRNREDPSFSIVIGRATKAGQRLDRVQVLASATYEFGD